MYVYALVAPIVLPSISHKTSGWAVHIPAGKLILHLQQLAFPSGSCWPLSEFGWYTTNTNPGFALVNIQGHTYN